MKYLVLGAGMMGRAAAYDIATRNPSDEVLLADIDLQAATTAAKAIGPNVRPLRVDVNNEKELNDALRGCTATISAVSYSVNYAVTRAAIRAGVHMCDLGGNNDVVERQLSLNEEAQRAGVAIVPNCGLAPGLINILAVGGANEFEAVDTIQLRVGGLPQHPRPPLNYQIVFSVEGLINEYIERAEVIRDGNVIQVDSMADLEDIEFPPPYGHLEAFNTSGGLSTLTRHFKGKVRNLDYKTIRYRGHCEKFKTLLDLGFASGEPLMIGGSVRTSREYFEELLKKKLDFGDTDLILARATITGRRANARQTLTYEFIDLHDEKTGISAMARTTSYPTTVIAMMLARGTITSRGVMPPELCTPADAMIAELGKRNIRILKRFTEHRS